MLKGSRLVQIMLVEIQYLPNKELVKFRTLTKFLSMIVFFFDQRISVALTDRT